MTPEQLTTLVGGSLAAFLAACLGVPTARTLARRWGLVDVPDAHRKLHGQGTPLGGGVVVLAATLLGLSLLAASSPDFRERVLASGGELGGFFAASLVIAGIGLLDDAKGLRGRQKLAGQCVAVLILLGSGMSIQRIGLFGWEIDLGLLAAPFTLCWYLGAINAMNLLDGADGMATTVGLVISVALAILAASIGRPVEAAIAAAMAGALAGFLRYNFPPASIFLGDCGSMLMGLAIGVLAVRASLKGPATVAMAAPVALLAVPMLDCTAAILRRRLTGRSIYTTDRGHLHHCLLRRGAGPRGLLAWVAALCGATAVGTLLSTYWRNENLAILTAATVIVVLVASRIFGYSEFRLVANRTTAFAASMIVPSRAAPGLIRQQAVMLQGSRNWNEIWRTLTDFAETHHLGRICLDLSLPWMHEGYHAEWERQTSLDHFQMCSFKLPLVAHGRQIGRLEILGPAPTEDGDYQVLVLVAEVLETIEPCLRRLSAELPKDALDEPRKPARLVPQNR